jgi:hypothetical protein
MAQNPFKAVQPCTLGLDYHKHNFVATTMDEQGAVVKQVRLCNDPDTLGGYAKRLPLGSKSNRQLVLLL